MISRNWLTSLEFSSACSVPVRTWVDGGRIGLIRSTTPAALTPGPAATKIRSTRPSLSSRRCASANGEDGDRRSPQRGDRAELGDARDREPADGADRRDADPFADLEAFGVGGALVDHDLAIIGGPVADGQRHRVEAGLRRGRSRSRRSGSRRSRSTCRRGRSSWALSEEPSRSKIAPRRVGDARQLPHPGRERFGDRHVAGRFGDDALAGDHRAGAFVGGGEDAVECPRDRVGEDVGAADHRHAEDDRDRGQDRAAAAEKQPFSATRLTEPAARSCVAATTSATSGVGAGRGRSSRRRGRGRGRRRGGGGVVGDHQTSSGRRRRPRSAAGRGSQRCWRSRGCRSARRRRRPSAWRPGRGRSRPAAAGRPRARPGGASAGRRGRPAPIRSASQSLVGLRRRRSPAAGGCSPPRSASAAG